MADDFAYNIPFAMYPYDPKPVGFYYRRALRTHTAHIYYTPFTLDPDSHKHPAGLRSRPRTRVPK